MNWNEDSPFFKKKPATPPTALVYRRRPTLGEGERFFELIEMTDKMILLDRLYVVLNRRDDEILAGFNIRWD